MSAIRKMKTNPEAVLSGSWVKLGKNDDGSICRIKLARMSMTNTNYQRVLERLTEPFKAEMEAGTFTPEMDRNITKEAVAEAIILDWENMQLGTDGKSVPYSKPQAVEVLKDDSFYDFYNFVLGAANNVENFLADKVKALSGN